MVFAKIFSKDIQMHKAKNVTIVDSEAGLNDVVFVIYFMIGMGSIQR